MPDFRPAPDGARLVLDKAEAELLKNLTSEYRALLRGGRTDRGDPVYDRLFPSAYETAEDERAYRDLVGDDLQTHKLEALDRVTSSLEATDITIDGEDFDAWVQTLTDLRLAIGTRLDVDEDRMAAEPDPHDPDTPSLQVLHWLGWIQQGLIEARGNITNQ
jgi:hypothetical protein